MACDLCGRTGIPLGPLLDIYQTPQIKSICDSCGHEVNKHLRKLQTAVGNLQGNLLKQWLLRTRIAVWGRLRPKAPDPEPAIPELIRDTLEEAMARNHTRATKMGFHNVESALIRLGDMLKERRDFGHTGAAMRDMDQAMLYRKATTRAHEIGCGSVEIAIAALHVLRVQMANTPPPPGRE